MKIEFARVQKRLGDQFSLGEISCSVPSGSSLGLVGPNGSGKTTLLRLLTGLYTPDSGFVTVDGVRSSDDQYYRIRGRFGVVLDYPALYGNLTASQNLEFFDRLYFPKSTHEERRSRITAALASAHLTNCAERRVREFSKGMKQRLALARAFNHSPELIVFDEPFQGLDIDGVIELREYLRDLNRSGVTMVIASHDLNHLERVCDSYCLIAEGQQLGVGTKHSLSHGLDGVALQLPNELIRKGDRVIQQEGENASIIFTGKKDPRVSQFGVEADSLSLENLYRAYRSI